MNDSLIKAVSEFPTPTTVTDLRSWLGLANQLGPFISEISHLASQLRPLLKKENEFCWTPVHDETFKRMRKELSSVATLAFYDPTRQTLLQADASQTKGLGFLLKQKQDDGTWHLVQCGSRWLTEAESRYAMIELELLFVVWATMKCRLFLEGLPHFDVWTDHAPLLPFLNKYTLDCIDNPRLQRLRRQLDRFSFTAFWIKGKDNEAADALSRAPVDTASSEDEIGEEVQHIDLVYAVLKESMDDGQDGFVHRVAEASKDDPVYQALKKIILNGFPSEKKRLAAPLRPYWNVREKLSVDHDLIVCGPRLLIPSSHRREVLDQLLKLHQGATKTKQRARLAVYWPSVDRDITQHCATC